MSENFYIGLSKHGKGVFAKRDVEKGELIFVFYGDLKEGYRYDEYLPFSEYWVQIDDRRWIDPMSIGRYVNHSCEPNSAVYGLFELRALRNINSYEEIFFDYDTTDWDAEVCKFNCHCLTKNCRRIIREYNFLSDVTKQRYREYGLIPFFLLELEDNHQ